MSQALDYWHEVFLTLFSSGKNCIFQIFVLRTQFSLSFSSILVSCKGLYRQSYGFSSSHVWMWALDHKEGWAPKNWCFQIVVLEKTLTTRRLYQSILKEINPEYFLEGLMLKLQHSGHLIKRADTLAKTLKMGKLRTGGERGTENEMIG